MVNKLKEKRKKRILRHRRVRAKIKGTNKRPRLSLFKSNKHIYLQLIDDIKGRTLVSASDSEIKEKKGTKTEKAFLVGKLIAEKAIKKGIKSAVFDRGGWKYHGRVKKVAEGAREGGLKI